MSESIEHPILGKLSWEADLSCWCTEVELRSGCLINLRLSTRFDLSPTDNLEVLLNGGVAMLGWARRSEHDCRERITDELLDLYHDDWAPEDATTPMSRAEFFNRLVPNSLVRDIDGSGFFYWGDDGMFAGHWIEVRFGQDYVISEVGLAG